jgi:hypothetical protein
MLSVYGRAILIGTVIMSWTIDKLATGGRAISLWYCCPRGLNADAYAGKIYWGYVDSKSLLGGRLPLKYGFFLLSS